MKPFFAIPVALLLAALFGCGRAPLPVKPTPAQPAATVPATSAAPLAASATPPLPAQSEPLPPKPAAAAPYDNLLCRADDEEAARAIAALYEIEFVSFSYHIATFHTDEDPRDVIKRGKQNGWTELSVNGMNYAFSE